MHCPHCQQTIPETVSFCTQCGQPLTGVDTTDTLCCEAHGSLEIVQLFSDRVRIVLSEKRFHDIAYTQIASVKLEKDYLQIVKQGERAPKPGKFSAAGHDGSVLISTQQRPAFLELVAALRAQVPQATITDVVASSSAPPAASSRIAANGQNGRIWLEGQTVTLEVTGKRGMTTIPLAQVTSIEYTPASTFHPGSLQLVPGAKTLWSVGEQIVRFSKRQMPEFEALQQAITARLQPTSSPAMVTTSSSAAEEIAKLAALRDQGILTDEEFAAKKCQLLDL